MKTILIVASHPESAEAIRAALNPEQYRVIHRIDLAEAEPFLNPSLLDACILDLEFSQVEAIWMIEKVRSRVPKCPLLVYASSKSWDWEEDAYVHGVTHVLAKPVRSRMLNALLDRLWSVAPAWPAPSAPPHSVALRARESRPVQSPTEGTQAQHALQVVRDFSAVMTHSLRADAML